MGMVVKWSTMYIYIYIYISAVVGKKAGASMDTPTIAGHAPHFSFVL